MSCIPVDAVAELGLSAALFRFPEEFIPPLVGLSLQLFEDPVQRALAEGIRELYTAGRPIDPVTLSSLLRSNGTYELVGGAVGVREMAHRGVTTEQGREYFRILRGLSLRRTIIGQSNLAITRAMSMSEDIAAVRDDLENALSSAAGTQQEQTLPARAVLPDVISSMTRDLELRGKLSGVTSGFAALDALHSGFQPGDMIIVAGRPGTGKSALAMGMVEAAAVAPAVERRTPTAVFSLEMTRVQVLKRAVIARARVDANKLASGLASGPELERIERAAMEWKEAPVFINDTSGLPVSALRLELRRLRRLHNIGLAVIDYVQLMRSLSARAQRDRQLEITEISAGIKATAKELQIPIIVLAQLNRDADGRRPRISDLRESGSLEQDADDVVLIDCSGNEDDDDDDEGSSVNVVDARLLVAKCRNGPVAEVALQFHKAFVRFEPATLKQTQLFKK